MDRYDTLLFGLLATINEKMDKLISLIEESQDAKNGSNNGATAKKESPDFSQD